MKAYKLSGGKVIAEGNFADERAIPDGWTTTPPAPAANPAAVPVVNYVKSMTPIRFKLALGQPARLAIRAAVSYEGVDPDDLMKAAILADWWDIFNDPTLVAVSVDDPDTIAALGYLVSIGILTEPEVSDILLGVPA